MDDHPISTSGEICDIGPVHHSGDHGVIQQTPDIPIESSTICTGVVSVDQTPSSTKKGFSEKRLTQAEEKEKDKNTKGELYGMDNLAYESETPVVENAQTKVETSISDHVSTNTQQIDVQVLSSLNESAIELRGLDSPIYDIEDRRPSSISHNDSTEVHVPLPDDRAISIDQTDDQPASFSTPSSTSEDVAVELGGLDNPAYETETTTPSSDLNNKNVSEETKFTEERAKNNIIASEDHDHDHDDDTPMSFTPPSSISEDVAIELSGLESPTHDEETDPRLLPGIGIDNDNNSTNTLTPTPLEETVILIEEQGSISPPLATPPKALGETVVAVPFEAQDATAIQPTMPQQLKETVVVPIDDHVDSTRPSMEEQGAATPPSTTVVTAVVESVEAEDKHDHQEDTAAVVVDPTAPPESVMSDENITKKSLLEAVAINTSLLATGEDLPSLPPPHFVPIDEFSSGQMVFDCSMDKTALAELEMKILQKSESASPPKAERCDSQLSTLSDKLDICRICHCEGEENNKLISPCLCSGSLKYLHLACLQKWIKSSDKKSCELCNFDYNMSTKTRPFKEWEKLEMSHTERRKVVCSVTFHIIAITCVIWSLYVLIDRTTEEVHLGTLDWPFWTKLIVVAIGFTGGMIFMYVQCKMYVHLCVRWRAYNKLIFIENAPEDPQLRAEAAARIKDKAGEEGGVVNPVALADLDAV